MISNKIQHWLEVILAPSMRVTKKVSRFGSKIRVLYIPFAYPIKKYRLYLLPFF